MVEAGANEIPEAEILDALDIAHDEIKKLCAAPARAGREGRQAEDGGRGRRRSTRACSSEIQASHGAALDEATQVEDKLERQDATKAVEEEVLDAVRRRPRGRGLRGAPRRGPARVRQAREDDHPPAHRGRQEAPRRPRRRRDPADLDRGRRRAAHARLGAVHARPDAGASRRRPRHARARRCASTRSGSRRTKRYFHHYNFPPFSVGEAGFMRGPKRRDIGHGALAERALVPMIPSHGGLPVHDPRRLGHPRVQRLVVDGLGLRLHRCR